jgi:hypothetical protein
VINADIAATEGAINYLLDSEGFDGPSHLLGMSERHLSLLSTFLELRKHQLAQACPVCDGDGFIDEKAPNTPPHSLRTVKRPCPSKTNHM